MNASGCRVIIPCCILPLIIVFVLKKKHVISLITRCKNALFAIALHDHCHFWVILADKINRKKILN